jgi:aspartyl-tRNA(Asn)/glutamyl-tRNA(Gln) amidotransferase subunit A
VSEPFSATLGELGARLAKRELSSVELTRAFLQRIARLNGELNAFITVDEERALADARRADERLAGKGNAAAAGPLAGIPIAHKDILCTAGMRTTCGSRMLADYRSPYDAHVIERFAEAGAVLLG